MRENDDFEIIFLSNIFEIISGIFEINIPTKEAGNKNVHKSFF